MTLKVSDIGEKELVKYIIANSKKITPDDTAITKFNSTNLISTCDMLIQSRHFPKNMSYFDMGFKAVTVNVSDLAAMGAEPFGFLLAIAIPKDLELDSFKEIIDGVLNACDYYSIPLIGGDTNEASEIIISGTALGLCEEPLMMDTYSKKGWKVKNPKLDVFFIVGGNDKVAKGEKNFLKSVQFLKDIGYSNVTYKIYYGCKHAVFKDKPDEVFADVLAFLEN